MSRRGRPGGAAAARRVTRRSARGAGERTPWEDGDEEAEVEAPKRRGRWWRRASAMCSASLRDGANDSGEHT